MAEHPLVEKVAAELFARLHVGTVRPERAMEALRASQIETAYYDLAKAAIRVVLTWEPTEAQMLDALKSYGLVVTASDAFKAMNAALLREVEGDGGMG